MSRVAWWVLLALWIVVIVGQHSLRMDNAANKAKVDEIRKDIWCPKVYKGLRIEWQGETHLYNPSARTFSCRYKKDFAT